MYFQNRSPSSSPRGSGAAPGAGGAPGAVRALAGRAALVAARATRQAPGPRSVQVRN